MFYPNDPSNILQIRESKNSLPLKSNYYKMGRNTIFVLTVLAIILIALINMVYQIIFINGHGNGEPNLTINISRTRSLSSNPNPPLINTSRVRIRTRKSTPEYILNTQYCKIPKTEIMPPYYRANWRLEQVPDCSYETRLGDVNHEQILKLHTEYQHESCCIYEISRISGDRGEDGLFRLSDCKKVDSEKKTKNLEMYLLQCNKSLNFEANLPIHPNVQTKLKYWKTRATSVPDSLPINVLLIGLDAASRSHAYRSLPKTLSFLTQLGFHDFQAYHSVAPSTLTNFMAFLMGLERTQVRETCTADWASTFDSCPFIWKRFSYHNYVTMYIEDNTQTFNWGGQSGFREKPTDYYIHALFNAIEWIRAKNGTNTVHDYCTSQETVPQFQIRYTRRFLEKFKNTPFFSFTWFTHPFHSNAYTLQTLEDELLALFQYIKSEDSLLRNTLIVLLSDHGMRQWEGDFYDMNPMESYIERGLPLFFIRVPERLREMYPDMNLNEVMRRNSEQLTSPFDLHHTLLDLLVLTGLSSDPTFLPVYQDRSSLFTSIQEINAIRNCPALHIVPHVCVCNVIMAGEPFYSPFYLGKIAESLEHRLESYVKKSNYTLVCADWIVRTGDVISATVMSKDNNSTVYLVLFSANPGNAKFEAKVRIAHSQSTFDNCQVGDLTRINSYGDAGSCIGSTTDADKELKAFCICNEAVVEPKHGF